MIRLPSQIIRSQTLITCIAHHALEWIFGLAEFADRLAQCRFCLSKFDFKVVHLASTKHHSADEQAWPSTRGKSKSLLEDDHPLLVMEPCDYTLVKATGIIEHSTKHKVLTARFPHLISSSNTYNLSAIVELLQVQVNDAYFQIRGAQVFHTTCKLTASSKALLVWRLAVNSVIQIVVPTSCKWCKLCYHIIHRSQCTSPNLLWMGHYCKTFPGHIWPYESFKSYHVNQHSRLFQSLTTPCVDELSEFAIYVFRLSSTVGMPNLRFPITQPLVPTTWYTQGWWNKYIHNYSLKKLRCCDNGTSRVYNF